MANTVSEFNRSFIIQVSNDEGEDKGCYRIDQFISPRDGVRGEERVRNQVERSLFHKWRKTGLTHSIIYEGNPEMATVIMQQELAGKV